MNWRGFVGCVSWSCKKRDGEGLGIEREVECAESMGDFVSEGGKGRENEERGKGKEKTTLRGKMAPSLPTEIRILG